MKIIAIAIAFVASAALANPTGGAATTDHGKGHAGKAMKPATKEAAAATTAAPATCSEADAKAGKCKPEATK